MEHSHGHAPMPELTEDGTLPQALLRDMIERNEHRCEALAELLDTLEGRARRELLGAIGSFEAGGVQLREALELLEEETRAGESL